MTGKRRGPTPKKKKRRWKAECEECATVNEVYAGEKPHLHTPCTRCGHPYGRYIEVPG